jgi:SAM-dependent methyltransferase
MTTGQKSAAAAFILVAALGSAVLSPGQTSQSDAERFDRIARTVFKPIYPALARQIKEDYGITKGICVDAGAGPGYLSIELAKITELAVWAVDIDPAAVRIAERNVRDAGLVGRVKPVEGDVLKMPFDSRSTSSSAAALFSSGKTRSGACARSGGSSNRVARPFSGAERAGSCRRTCGSPFRARWMS